jgi:branched-subunit amino acid transport protein
MSAVWAAVLLVGAGSYLLRAAPFLLAHRLVVPDRMAGVLRDAGIAALAALLATSVARVGVQSAGAERAVVLLALLSAAVAGLAGRSVHAVLLVGGAVYVVGSMAATAL